VRSNKSEETEFGDAFLLYAFDVSMQKSGTVESTFIFSSSFLHHRNLLFLKTCRLRRSKIHRRIKDKQRSVFVYIISLSLACYAFLQYRRWTY